MCITLSPFHTLCQECPFEYTVPDNFVLYAMPYNEYDIKNGEHWQLTTPEGHVLVSIDEDQRIRLWDHLCDPATGEMWESLRYRYLREGLHVRIHDTDHNIVEWWPDMELADDPVQYICQCIAYATAHHGYIMLRNYDDDHRPRYKFFNRRSDLTMKGVASVVMDGHIIGFSVDDYTEIDEQGLGCWH